jgi:hypothetical protein
MATITQRLSEWQQASIDRVFSAQGRLDGNVRQAVAGVLPKVPGVQRFSALVQELTMAQLFSRTATHGPEIS